MYFIGTFICKPDASYRRFIYFPSRCQIMYHIVKAYTIKIVKERVAWRSGWKYWPAVKTFQPVVHTEVHCVSSRYHRELKVQKSCKLVFHSILPLLVSSSKSTTVFICMSNISSVTRRLIVLEIVATLWLSCDASFRCYCCATGDTRDKDDFLGSYNLLIHCKL